ncbi:MAG: flagellar hook-basal body complex protein [Pseudomonadota bacterium]
MTLSSSLSAGVSGLQVNATRLAVISDNIANSSTTGYRRGDVEFSSLVIPGSQNSYSAGGVRANTFRQVATPGTLISTSSALDLSVSGRGFLPVTEETAVDEAANQRPFSLTATGGFSRNADGYLVSRQGLALLGFPTDGEGNLLGNVVRDSPASLEPIQVTNFLNNSESTTMIELNVNLPADATLAGADGEPYTSSIDYFDGVGRRNTLTVIYTPNVPAAGSSDLWNVSFIDSATDPVNPIADFDVQFDPSRAGRGSIDTVTPNAGITYDAATGIAQITVADGPIDVFVGSDQVVGGLTQIDAGFSPVSVTANGAPAGNLASLEVDPDGLLRGVYDTGQQIVLYRIPVVDVPNPNGLSSGDAQTFTITSESGTPFFWDANTGPAGGIEGFSLQESTVDIARELTGLIQTQRAYSSNATVVQTVDEMLQETTNLKR